MRVGLEDHQFNAVAGAVAIGPHQDHFLPLMLDGPDLALVSDEAVTAGNATGEIVFLRHRGEAARHRCHLVRINDCVHILLL